MEKALAGSRFAGLSWEDILQGYFGRELVGRKAQKQKEKEERERFFAEIIETAPGSGQSVVRTGPGGKGGRLSAADEALSRAAG